MKETCTKTCWTCNNNFKSNSADKCLNSSKIKTSRITPTAINSMFRLVAVVKMANQSYKLTTSSHSNNQHKIVLRIILRLTRQQLLVITRTINGLPEKLHLPLMEVKKSYSSHKDLILLGVLQRATITGMLMLPIQASNNRTLIIKTELTSQLKTPKRQWTIPQPFKALTKLEEETQLTKLS